MSEHIYCGKGKKGQYGIRVNLCLSDIPREHMTQSKGKTFVNLDVSERRTPDEWGNTHSVKVNTWKPPQSASQPPPPEDGDDLPF